MEPRELYDPEDIEQLLIERAFDELLEEERAFVLRHLSDRTEYERMRALLLRMHTDEEDAPVVDADTSVRTHVMEVFRAQQQPQWRIWLNSIAAFATPREPVDLWRPALAFGALALVTSLAVTGLRDAAAPEADALAEVRQTPNPVPPPSAAEPGSTASNGTSSATVPTERSAAETTVEVPVVSNEAVVAPLEEAAEPPPGGIAEQLLAPSMAADEADDRSFIATDMATIAVDTVSIAPSMIESHIVLREELARNASTATGSTVLAQEVVKSTSVSKSKVLQSTSKEKRERKTSKTGDSDAAVADVGDLVGLLRAAW